MEWLKNILVGLKYKRIIKKEGGNSDWEEMKRIEDFLKNCEIRIMDYSNCKEIETTLGLRIRYGNKDFFFYERGNFGLDTGARQYDMEYDGSGMAVSKLNK